MSGLAQVGDFCPNEACSDYGKLQADQSKRNIIKFGKSRQGRQRYRCKICGVAFCETTGTIFHGRRKSEQEIVETLAWLAEGSRISSVSRVKGYKEGNYTGPGTRESKRVMAGVLDDLLIWQFVI